MDVESIREYCLSFPDATEDVQWENDLLFRIGGKIFAGVPLDPAAPSALTFKCTPEKFSELIEREGIGPAAYVGRYKWVALESFNALPDPEIKELIRTSYDLVSAKLPKSKRTGKK